MRAGDIVGGRFEVQGQAGVGGMGTVYRTIEIGSGIPIALKVLRGRSEVEVQRFVREAEALRTLQHPRIVGYVAHGTTHEGDPYLAMHWLEGEDLEARLARGPLGVDEALTLALHVAEALGFAHAHGFVHRDVKPSNIFLEGRDLARATVVDFGVARQLEGGTPLTTTGAIVGTLQYMAPEQARGDRGVDARADVFALGCVLYECLTGRAPFGAAQGLAVIAQILFDDPPRPSSVRELSPAIDALVFRMIAKDRARRPADGAAAALEIGTMGTGGTSAPSASADPVAPIGSDEQRVVSVAVATMSEPADATWTPDRLSDIDARIAACAASVNAKVELLASGSVIASVASGTGRGDHAVRATRLALAMGEILPNSRVAVVTGMALLRETRFDSGLVQRAVTLTGSDAPVDLATPTASGVRVDAATAQAIDGRFDTEQRGGTTFVLRERTGPSALAGAGRVPTQEIPCLGRERELAVLEGALAECVEDGVARAAVLVAAAGFGKTRLCNEFVSRASQRYPDARVIRGNGDQTRSGSPFATIAPALRSLASIHASADADTQRTALRAFVVGELGPAMGATATVFLGEMLGLPFADDDTVLIAARRDAQLMADRMRSAWISLLDALTRKQPLVLVLEDLHWGDLPSLRFVDAALHVLGDRPLFVAATARPEYRDAFPDLWKHREPIEVPLPPLSARASERMIRALLGADATPESVRDLVRAADGHPFLLAQLSQSASFGGLGATSFSVLGVLHSRLDSLNSAQRRALRSASVYGDRFWEAGVAALLDPHGSASIGATLQTLVDMNMIASHADSDFAGQREYAFRHALLREAVHASIPESDLAPAHAGAGHWLERAGEHDALVLARHFEQGRVFGRAAYHYARAADAALAASDVSRAIEYATHALRHVSSTTEGCGVSAFHLYKVIAEAAYYNGDLARAVDSARRAVEGASPGSREWFDAVAWIVTSSGQRGDNDEVERWLDPIATADAAPDALAAQSICLSRAMTQLIPAGRLGPVRRHLDRAASLIHSVARSEPAAVAWYERVHATIAFRTSPAAALEAAQRAIDAMQRCGDERGLCFLRITSGTAHLLLGEYEAAERSAQQGIALAERLGVDYLRHWAAFTIGKIHAMKGDLHGARERLEPVIRAVSSSPRIVSSAAIYLSRAALLAGDVALALDAASRALEMKVGPPMRAAADAAFARAAVAGGRGSEALEHAAGAMETLNRLGEIEEFETLIRLAYAEALAAVGRTNDAHAAAEEAKARILGIAAGLDTARRDSFLTRVPENVATLGLRTE